MVSSQVALAMHFLPLHSISGSAGLVVFGSVVGHCSSDPLPLFSDARSGVRPIDTVVDATVGAGVTSGKATLNATLGTEMGIATVAGKDGVAWVEAGAVPDLEACVFFAELFLSCVL